ncbi:DUF5954 family protein [Micromonospora hortensis]|uniref:DUF5954 family protein n=1 Tax=Micromonospora hortensis TaxID=2911209 RepID=UPI001EE8AA90|nr:DUF5954 family protein [Micromonospora hortensis]MCG5451018.1 DUF5954 family protein [Micromonospora hortensis]
MKVPAFIDNTPQQARDTLARRLREPLAEATDAKFAAELTEWRTIVDSEKADEVIAAGRHWRMNAGMRS